jgi:hypothetical protein
MVCRRKKSRPTQGQAASLSFPAIVRKDGAGEESRTPDLRITNALLYQLSYTGAEKAWKYSQK